MMRLLALLLLFSFAVGCTSTEPINGCVLAAANRREVLRAKAYLHPAIPARILGVRFAARRGAPNVGHAALIYRLQGGWWAYDDTFASRALRLPALSFPDPIIAARAAFPARVVTGARYLDPAR